MAANMVYFKVYKMVGKMAAFKFNIMLYLSERGSCVVFLKFKILVSNTTYANYIFILFLKKRKIFFFNKMKWRTQFTFSTHIYKANSCINEEACSPMYLYRATLKLQVLLWHTIYKHNDAIHTNGEISLYSTKDTRETFCRDALNKAGFNFAIG